MAKDMNTEALVRKIKDASEAYYLGNPIITDAEFDILIDSLRDLEPHNPILKQVGAELSTTPWPIVDHKRPMGSLHKVNTEDEFLKWAKKYTSGLVCLSDKLDGLSIALDYKDGKLVRGVTRGDGFKGEDITVNIKRLKGVKPTIPHKGEVSIRGEAVLLTVDYKKHFPRKELDDGTVENANARNCVAVIRRKKNNTAAMHVSFLAYDMVSIDGDFEPETKEEIFRALHHLGFTIPYYKVADSARIWTLFEAHGGDDGLRKKKPYEIDGMVAEDNSVANFKEQGESSGRPRAARAIKFAASVGKSTIRNIEYQVGRTGVVTPVAKIDPVTIGGVTITSPSLMNIAECIRIGVQKDAKIVVERCNDVIPRVIQSEGGKPFMIPNKVDGFEVCLRFALKDEDRVYRLQKPIPLTAAGLKAVGINVDETSSVMLFCDDPNHPTRKFRRLENFVKTLDIKGIGEKTIQALIDAGSLKELTDYFNLTIHDWEHATGSPTLAKKVKKEFADKTRAVPLPTFIKALGMTFFGEDTARLIEEQYPDVSKWPTLGISELGDIKGIGQAKANAAIQGLHKHGEEIQELLKHVKIGEPESVSDDAVTVCFTGVRLPLIYLEAFKTKGYREVSGVSKKTQILVLMDTTSTSGKAKKAREYGTKMVSYDDFLKEIRS